MFQCLGVSQHVSSVQCFSDCVSELLVCMSVFHCVSVCQFKYVSICQKYVSVCQPVNHVLVCVSVSKPVSLYVRVSAFFLGCQHVSMYQSACVYLIFQYVSECASVCKLSSNKVSTENENQYLEKRTW